MNLIGIAVQTTAGLVCAMLIGRDAALAYMAAACLLHAVAMRMAGTVDRWKRSEA